MWSPPVAARDRRWRPRASRCCAGSFRATTGRRPAAHFESFVPKRRLASEYKGYVEVVARLRSPWGMTRLGISGWSTEAREIPDRARLSADRRPTTSTEFHREPEPGRRVARRRLRARTRVIQGRFVNETSRRSVNMKAPARRGARHRGSTNRLDTTGPISRLSAQVAHQWGWGRSRRSRMDNGMKATTKVSHFVAVRRTRTAPPLSGLVSPT